MVTGWVYHHEAGRPHRLKVRWSLAAATESLGRCVGIWEQRSGVGGVGSEWKEGKPVNVVWRGAPFICVFRCVLGD